MEELSSQSSLDTLSEPSIDGARALSHACGDMDLFARLVGVFLRTGPADMALLVDALNSDGIDETCRLAHRVAGSASTMGARTTERLARRIELELAQGKSQKARVTLGELQMALARDLRALQGLIIPKTALSPPALTGV
ncbi:MAG: Hpt domain-containing protein [Myxococcota bacterium]|jgi:HPt (histidine-containing phosphotransfer) domain-containing protein|nr:Hpt domain-containing protein [Myxococcota bacterium]